MFSLFFPSKKRPRPPSLVQRDERHDCVYENLHVRIVRKARLRRLTMTVKLNGHVQVRGPKGMTDPQVRAFIQENRNWILRQQEVGERLRAEYPRKNLQSGEVFPLFGRSLTLSYHVSERSRLSFTTHNDQLIGHVPRAIWSQFDPTQPHREYFPALRKLYATSGRQILADRVETLSLAMRVQPRGLSFRSQKTRWGSCSPSGRISLNWRLAVAPIEVIDYVVIHELAHLKHHNHSPHFWQFVGEYCPSFKEQQRWLAVNQFASDFLAQKSELHFEAKIEHDRRPKGIA